MSDQTKKRRKFKKRYILISILFIIVVATAVMLYIIFFSHPRVSQTNEVEVEIPGSSNSTSSISSESQDASGDDPATAAMAIATQIQQSGTPQNDQEKLKVANLYISQASYVASAGDYKQAYELAQNALKLSQNWKIYQNAAQIHLAANDTAGAIDLLNKADAALKATSEYDYYHSELQGQIDRLKNGTENE